MKCWQVQLTTMTVSQSLDSSDPRFNEARVNFGNPGNDRR